MPLIVGETPNNIFLGGIASTGSNSIGGANIYDNRLGYRGRLVPTWFVISGGTYKNLKLNFREDAGGELIATLTGSLAGTIYGATELAAEIKSKLELAGAGTYTVVFSEAT